jgi:ABC-type branched-subunit amino acid transport system substrate-binding protein
MHYPRPLKFTLYLCFLFTAAAPAIAGDALSQQENCGKRIYFQGTDCKGHEIRGFLGDMQVSATVQSCSSCHGADGRGRPESGLDPGDITWEHLIVPYGHSHESGRKHAAFTQQSFYLAVTRGLDPSGHKLSPLMPRFRLSQQQVAELAAYLQRLTSDFDPGLSATNITFGSLLPAGSGNGDPGSAIRAVLTAYFDEVNQHGGIYGRKITLQFADSVTDLKNQLTGSVFALVAPFAPSAETELVTLANESKLPVVGPLTLSAPEEDQNREVFYLSPGLQQMAQELVRWAVQERHAEPSHSAMIFSDAKLREDISPVFSAAWQETGPAGPQEFDYSPENAVQLARALQQQGTTSIFFAGSGKDALGFLQGASQVGWNPQVFLFGPLAGDALLEASAQFQGKIYEAFPAIAATTAATEDFQAFSQRHHLPTQHRLVEISAYCAGRMVEDALVRSGSELSRQKFVKSLEETREFQTGLLPEISFGPNRHVGSTRVDILCDDLEAGQVRVCSKGP